ncbi:N-6 DNA methylase [Desulfococcaceae bacterium HSG7]|nr:N-6 DNA methylase [Desulfococcaceae bacterium HSG7]
MPKITRHIFNRKKLTSVLNNLSVEHLADHTDYSDIKLRIDNWRSLIDRKILEGKNEISLQGDFLSDFFGKILGYKSINESPDQWHLYREKKTVTDATRSDAALGFFTSEKDDVRVIIELKDAKTNLDAKQKRKGAHYTPVEQAFLYSSKFDKKCKWIIVSNYKEIRLYNRLASMNAYESFKIADLSDVAVLKKFLYLLVRKNLIDKNKDSVTDRLYDSAEVEQEMITKEFYGKYKNLRLHLFEHLKAKNSAFDEAIILEKTQKILDRFIFVCYCEDFGLLPERIFRKMTEAVKNPMLFADVSQWDQLKNLFRAIDQGKPQKNINKFNGGLFEFDEILDGRLNIGDEIFDELAEITDYDFDSELNVNVLGHIFEQSITDIEEIKSSIAGESFDKKKGKRKKDGIYYTPEYITRYIVEQAVGGWLEERKAELGFEALAELTEKDFDSIKYLKKTGAIKSNKNIKAHLEFWQEYKKKLSAVKVLDPACGSGAFLNQAFDYLYKEGQHVNEQIADLQKGQIEVFRLDEHILKNNLYGVDLNPESVEITKLSLWLKTADRDSELTALDDNIKCGDSLIDDPDVAGERAFKWSDEFSEIMGDGGFDVVIGNPPYLNMTKNNTQIEHLNFYAKEFVSTKKANSKNIFVLFIEQSICLLKENAILSFIVPEGLFVTRSYSDCVKLIDNSGIIETIVKFEDRVFEDAVTGSLIFKFVKKLSNIKPKYFLFTKDKYFEEVKEGLDSVTTKMEKPDSVKLQEIALLFKGMVVKDRKLFLYHEDKKSITPDIFLLGNCMGRYLIFNQYYCDYPALKIVGGTKNKKKYDKYPRILIRRTGNRLCCALLEQKALTESTLYSVVLTSSGYSLKFILVILNSSLYTYYIRHKMLTNQQAFPQILMTDLKSLPIKIINSEQQKPFIEKADIMLSQNKKLWKLKTDFLNFLKSELKPQKITKKLENWPDSDWDQFKKELTKCKVKMKALSLKERKEWQEYFTEEKLKAAEIKSVVENTDREIDLMVYKLYGLTEEEIKIVENAA